MGFFSKGSDNKKQAAEAGSSRWQGAGFTALACLLLVGLVYPVVAQWPRVHRIAVSPSQHMSLVDVMAGLELGVWGGVNMTASLQPLYKRLGDMPWLKGWKVTRRWPDVVLISLEERVPVIELSDGRLVDEEGIIFKPEAKSVPHGLVRMKIEPSVSDESIRDAYRYVAPLQALVKQYHRGIKSIKVDEHGLITVYCLDSEEIMLGRTFQEQRVQRLEQALKFLASKRIKYHTIDMRYQHGFTIE